MGIQKKLKIYPHNTLHITRLHSFSLKKSHTTFLSSTHLFHLLSLLWISLVNCYFKSKEYFNLITWYFLSYIFLSYPLLYIYIYIFIDYFHLNGLVSSWIYIIVVFGVGAILGWLQHSAYMGIHQKLQYQVLCDKEVLICNTAIDAIPIRSGIALQKYSCSITVKCVHHQEYYYYHGWG